MNDPAPCPLCSSIDTRHFHQETQREYLICPICDVVFVHPKYYLRREAELKRYELHKNAIDDSGYRSFLQRLCGPLQERIAPESIGLDFGSGRGPLLKIMLEEQGHTISLFDTFFAPDIKVFNFAYDFITATEVVEHLQHPLIELDRLWSRLNSGGVLGVMTNMRNPETSFPTWHYLSDPTHIVFYSTGTMAWLANRWSATLEIISDSVVIFTKSG
jgi:hypothetical protein